MTDLLTASQMGAIEGAAIASGEVTGRRLMECAGRGTVDAILAWRPIFARSPHRAVILCGPGNNGGDGYVVARILHDQGWHVEVLGLGAGDAMPPDAAAMRALWSERDAVQALTEGAIRDAADADLYVDAVFGTGLSRPPEGDLAAALRLLGRAEGPHAGRIVAVDAPSGLDMDSGRMMGEDGQSVPRASLTVTFESMKLGHVLADGPACCGRVRVVDLGLGRWRSDFRAGSGADAPARLIGEASARSWLLGYAKRYGHKYDNGHAVIVSGGASTTGAARMAAQAALRVGAGLVTVASPPTAMMVNACQLTAIMVRAIADAEGLARMLDDRRLNAVCLGPGLGVGEGTRDLVAAALGDHARSGRAVVLDADALTSFADDPDALFRLIGADADSPKVILTPHGGEFARLFPDVAEQLEPVRPTTSSPRPVSKVEAARIAARRSGAIILLKGPDTVIAAPGGEVAINAAVYERSVPWLATAGAGDVLAGMIAGLAGRMPLFEAAERAAWLHTECARAFGPGLIAEDLPEIVPQVLRSLTEE